MANSPSTTWQSFSTFLDQVGQTPEQQPPQPGQIPTWANSFQLGQRPNYAYTPNPVSPTGQFPGMPTDPPVPGEQQQQFVTGAGSYQQNSEHNTLQQQTLLNTNPMAGFMTALGQGSNFAERRRQRQERNDKFSGGFGGGSYSNWNIR